MNTMTIDRYVDRYFAGLDAQYQKDIDAIAEDEAARQDWETSDEVIALIGQDESEEVLNLLADGDLTGASDRLDKAFATAWARRKMADQENAH